MARNAETMKSVQEDYLDNLVRTTPVFVYISLSQPVKWLIRRRDPLKVEIASLPGWALVSPFIQDELLDALPFRMEGRAARVVAMRGEDFLLESTRLVFDCSDLRTFSDTRNPVTGSPRPMAEFLAWTLPTIVRELVARIRQVTKQAGISRNFDWGMTVSRPKPVDHIEYPEQNENTKTYVSRYELDTAITLDVVRRMGPIEGADTDVPHETFIMDAIHSVLEADYRKTLLYAAIGMEIYAGMALSEAYEEILRNSGPRGAVALGDGQHRRRRFGDERSHIRSSGPSG